MDDNNNEQLQNITLWRAEYTMHKIMNELRNTQDDNLPEKLHKETYDKYLCGIKFNSNGFMPYINDKQILNKIFCVFHFIIA